MITLGMIISAIQMFGYNETYVSLLSEIRRFTADLVCDYEVNELTWVDFAHLRAYDALYATVGVIIVDGCFHVKFTGTDEDRAELKRVLGNLLF